MRIAAVDIGGTSIKTGIWNDQGLKETKEYPTDAKKGGPFVIERVIQILETYENINRIGISTAGQVDSMQGLIRYANENIPDYTGMPIQKIISDHFKVPVVVENDVNAAAIGEGVFGAGRDFSDFLCLTYGTGVGGAIVINKKLYTGSTFSAGEFGAMLIHPEDRIEGDFYSGCYEKYASTTALVRKAMEKDELLNSGRHIFDRIHEEEVKKLVDEWIMEIAYGLISFIHIFNPPCIILGGGIMSQEYIVEKLRKVVYTHIMPSFGNVVLKQAELGNRAGLLGAIHLACFRERD